MDILLILMAVSLIVCTGFLIKYKKLSCTDSLSGLFNRRQFDQDTRALKFRRATDNHILVLIDIDDFKLINDTYGHTEGDRVIKEIGSRLNRYLRDSDRAYRIGGDEFAILTNSYAIIDRVLVAAPMAVSISVGVACMRDSGSFITAFNEADKNLYKNKPQKA